MSDLGYKIMNCLVEIIKSDQSELSEDSLMHLDLIEVQPRSEEFAEEPRTCLISRFDPEDPNGWLDEEIQRWPPQQGPYEFEGGRNFNEPNSQAMHLSFTIKLKLFYSDLGVTKEEANLVANELTARIIRAIRNDTKKRPGQSIINGLKDDFGGVVIPYFRVVKKYSISPSGSEEEPNFTVKIWLRYLAEYH